MDISNITIEADTPGAAWRFPVFRFRGSEKGAPSVYIQAALHAGELPGTALAHFLLQRLEQAEAEGAIRGDIIVVPHANPIGLAQSHFGTLQGRFDLGTRGNFNRDFPLIALDARDTLLEGLEQRPAIDQLKRRLLHMALGADLVLDLHCDFESLQYTYIDPVFWPEAQDLAAELEMDAVFLSDGASTAFEESVGHAFKSAAPGAGTLPGRLAVTVELRGLNDVDEELAWRDADGLFRFLIRRGVVSGTLPQDKTFEGVVSPLDWVEVIRAPQAGVILFHRALGERVKAGDRLATLITQPGVATGEITVHAPQDGLVVTRVSQRYARRNGDLMKIACAAASAKQRPPGALED